MWYWEIATGLFGAFGYYVLRYDPNKELMFIEYLRIELFTLMKGVVGFGLIWGGWKAFNKFDLLPYQVTEMSPAVALVVGFAAKKIMDYTIGKLKKLTP